MPQTLPQPSPSQNPSGSRDDLRPSSLCPSSQSDLHGLSEELEEGSALLDLLAAAPASKTTRTLLRHWSRRMERMSGTAAHVAEQMPRR